MVVWDGRVSGGSDGRLGSEVVLNFDLLSLLSRERSVTLVCRSLDAPALFETHVPGLPVVNVGAWRGRPSLRVLVSTWRQLGRLGPRNSDLLLIGPGLLPLLVLLMCLGSSRELHRLLLVNSFAGRSLMARTGGSLPSRLLGVLLAIGSRLALVLSCRLATRVIAVSHDLARRVRASYVMPEIQWSSLERARSHDSTVRDIDILLAGRLEPEKGIVNASRRIVNALPGLRVLVVGSGSLRSELTEVMKGSSAEYLERLPHEKLLWTMRRSRVVVVPSITEGFGLVAFEAAVLGCVLVARPVGGLPEALSGQRCIWFDSLDELPIAVSEAMSQADCPAEMSSLELIRSRHSWSSPEDIIRLIETPRTSRKGHL